MAADGREKTKRRRERRSWHSARVNESLIHQPYQALKPADNRHGFYEISVLVSSTCTGASTAFHHASDYRLTQTQLPADLLFFSPLQAVEG